MSARRRRLRRPESPDPSRERELRWRAVALRDGWLAHALSTAPADRAAAETAVAALYARAGRRPPRPIWVDSPAEAIRHVDPPRESVTGRVQNELATQVSALRRRLELRDPNSFVGPEIRDVLRAGIRHGVAATVRAAIPARMGLYWLGQHDVDWIATHDVRVQVLGGRTDPDDAEALRWWSLLARSCHWWIPRERTCVVVERPAVQRVEDPLRLHAPDGPAVAYRDGFGVHAWHGVRVPSWVIERPDPARIARERNVEVRRCAIERLGWDAFVDGAGLRLAARAADPGNPGCELRLYDLDGDAWGPQTRLLLAVNGSPERDGTRRRYGLRVPSFLDDPVAAAGWTYGLTADQYARLRRRT